MVVFVVVVVVDSSSQVYSNSSFLLTRLMIIRMSSQQSEGSMQCICEARTNHEQEQNQETTSMITRISLPHMVETP
jgi:hypothetical protein